MIFPETEDNKEFSAWCINSRAPIKSKFAEFIYAFQLIKIRNCSLALIFVIILKNDVRRLYASLSSISSPPASKKRQFRALSAFMHIQLSFWEQFSFIACSFAYRSLLSTESMENLSLFFQLSEFYCHGNEFFRLRKQSHAYANMHKCVCVRLIIILLRDNRLNGVSKSLI